MSGTMLLGHKPGLDQPWLGHLREGVWCWKTRNAQWPQAHHWGCVPQHLRMHISFILENYEIMVWWRRTQKNRSSHSGLWLFTRRIYFVLLSWNYALPPQGKRKHSEEFFLCAHVITMAETKTYGHICWTQVWRAEIKNTKDSEH